MSITSSSSARRAGFKVGDKTVAELAAISMAKIGTRTLYRPLTAKAFHLAGTAAIDDVDICTTIKITDGAAGNLYTSFRLPAEYDSGSLVLSIYWRTTAITGNAKFVVDLASKADGGTTALEDTQNVITAANTTAAQVNKSQVTFASTLLTAGDLIGIKITRDGTDGSDTIAASLWVIAAALEFTGRG